MVLYNDKVKELIEHQFNQNRNNFSLGKVTGFDSATKMLTLVLCIIIIT